jgi:colanic acid/amylovoran biosynthesis glycosyltransferase
VGARVKVGYVLNQYPTVSATFILGEVRALRSLGVGVTTFSMWPTTASDRLSAAAEEEAGRTTTIRPVARLPVARAHARALARAPRAYADTVRVALRLRPPGLRAAIRQLFYFLAAMFVWDRAEREGIRHLHSHFSFLACDVALLASHYGAAAGEPWSFSFTVHGPDEFYELPTNRMQEKARRAAMVVCISHFARSQVMGLLDEADWQKVEVVRCGIEPERFRPAERSPRPRAARILNVGRLVPVKGQAVLLHAVASLVARGLDVELTIVGSGPQEAGLRRLVDELGLGDRVELAGAIGQDAIAEYYDRADILAVPSFAEGLPVVIMEALATGLPVVSTSIMGIPELVRDGETGALVPPGDADALADGLARLIDDPQERLRLGEAGREAVLAGFDQLASARALERLFAARRAA